jgi:hypothetical protein
LSRRIGCAEGDKTAGSSGRRYSARRALRHCVDRHKRRELFKFCDLKKNPLRDLRRVTEHPEGSTRGCLSRGIARRASKHSPSAGERKKDKIP